MKSKIQHITLFTDTIAAEFEGGLAEIVVHEQRVGGGVLVQLWDKDERVFLKMSPFVQWTFDEEGKRHLQRKDDEVLERPKRLFRVGANLVVWEDNHTGIIIHPPPCAVLLLLSECAAAAT